MLPMPDTQTDRQTTEDRDTQLIYSIQFKLSHAIYVGVFVELYRTTVPSP